MITSRAVIFSYCATFLPREMLHVYRQVTGVTVFDNRVITRTRVNPDRFPFPHVAVIKKSPWRGLVRIWHRARNAPVPLGRGEVRQVLQLAQETNASLLHVYLGSEALRALPLLKRFSGARVVSFHGADLSHQFSAADYSKLWGHAELFLCRSESLRQDLAAKGCPTGRIRLNYTGVPLPERIAARHPPAWRDGATVNVLQVCRLIEKKGLDVTLKAVARLKADGLGIRLILAGSGSAEDSLRNLAGELGLTDDVQFAGFVTGDALQDLYRRSHIFVHPSRETSDGDREGIPNSLLEAMSHGLPIVSSRHSGIPEAVEDGENGLLIDHCEPDLVAAAARRLLGDPVFYSRISENACANVAQRFSTASCIRSLEAVYREAISLRD